jgi:hypothetical protein
MLPLGGRVFGALALAACVGCASGDDVPDGGGEVAIAPLSRDVTNNGVTLTSAELSLHLVSLVACTSDAAVLNNKDFPIELLHEPWPRIIFESSVTDFCGVNLELDTQPSAALPDLQNLTALFRGTRADGTPFEIHSTLSTSFVFGPTNTALDAMNLVLGADLNAWLSNVDLDGADVTDEVVLVDADHNADVLAAFDSGANTAFALYVDADGNGAFSQNELTPVLTASTQ